MIVMKEIRGRVRHLRTTGKNDVEAGRYGYVHRKIFTDVNRFVMFESDFLLLISRAICWQLQRTVNV